MPRNLASLGIKTMLDAPCGDFHWMREVKTLPCRYIGGDIVDEIVRLNSERFGTPEREFRRLDVVEDDLPRADLIHCRDCLVHLPLRAAGRALQNFKRSGATYLLATTFPGTGRRNVDIPVGDWRPLNLCAAPFHLPPPMWLMREVAHARAGDIDACKCLGLWRLRNVVDEGA